MIFIKVILFKDSFASLCDFPATLLSRPISTQDNKHRIGLFLVIYYHAHHWTKKFFIVAVGSLFQTGAEIWYQEFIRVYIILVISDPIPSDHPEAEWNPPSLVSIQRSQSTSVCRARPRAQNLLLDTDIFFAANIV